MGMCYQNLDDEALAVSLQKGDRSAYTEIYHRYKQQLYVFAYQRLQDTEEVNDLVHDLFLNIWKNHDRIILQHSLSAYLYGSLRNRILNVIARKKVSDRYISSFVAYVATQDHTDHLVRHNELANIIEKEIATMPAKMRRVFELSRKNNLNRKEIAQQLGISEEAVKSHLHHAIKLLKKKFGALLLILFFIFENKMRFF